MSVSLHFHYAGFYRVFALGPGRPGPRHLGRAPSPARRLPPLQPGASPPERGVRGSGRVALHARHFPIDRYAQLSLRPNAAKGESGKHASPGRPAADSRLLVLGHVRARRCRTSPRRRANGPARGAAAAAVRQEGELVLLTGRLDPPRARAAAPPPRRARAGQSDGQSAWSRAGPIAADPPTAPACVRAGARSRTHAGARTRATGKEIFLASHTLPTSMGPYSASVARVPRKL